ncbi:MAG: hypothetical protein ABIH86_07630 [Planctomycetota bacterium]
MTAGNLALQTEIKTTNPVEFARVIKDVSRSLGADIIGIADPALLATEPPEHRPQSIFPEVKSIIVIGRRITRGSLRGIEEGTNWQTYHLFGRQWIEDTFLSRTAFEVTTVIEDNGFEAVPLFSYPLDIKEMGIPLRDGQPAPNVLCDPKRAAVAAGLGFISRLGEFISPEYGPLMRLSIILTDADIKPDAPLDINYCDGCSDCVQACPLQAINGDVASIQLQDSVRWNEFVFQRAVCKNCQNGAQPSRFVGSRDIDRIPAACGRACVASLERRGLLKKSFHNPFRVRRAWSVNLVGDVNSGDR